jgi:hypothetical protein
MYATIGGGQSNSAGDWAAIGGGINNQATNYASTVAGGDTNLASGSQAAIGGGAHNTASNNHATVGGGLDNSAGGADATIAGGVNNAAGGDYATVAGGWNNAAAGRSSTVGGGEGNSAPGNFAAIPGGEQNVAQGFHSFAAGRLARASNQGSFVWGDSTYSTITSPADNTFIVRANGGLWFGQASTAITPTIGAGVFISTSTGAYLSTGGIWTNASDRNLKANLAPVDGQEILARLAEVPVATWNYISQDPSVRHIGPMAQDFYAAFGLGEDNTHISTVDADGVALAAIQGLYAENQALKAENSAQQAQIDALAARLAALERAHPAGRPSLPGSWLGGGLVVVGGLLMTMTAGLVIIRRRTGGRR